MQSEVPQLDLTSHQPPTEIYLYGNDKLDDADMEAETPAHGNLSMKTSQSPELIEPMAPKLFSSSAKMFTFEGLTPSNSDDEARSQIQVGEEGAQTNADFEDREENESSAVLEPEPEPEPEPKIEIMQQMQPTEKTSKPQILTKRKETPKENVETPRAGPRRYERYMVDAMILRKDDASDNSTPFDEEPISPRGPLKSKKNNESTIPDHVLLQQKAIEEEIIFGTTQLTIGTLDANSFDSGLVEARPGPCPEVQAFVASLAASEEITMAPTDELEERSTISPVYETLPNYTATLCDELDKIQLFDMDWCTHR